MRYFTLEQIAAAIITACIFGAVSGILYAGTDVWIKEVCRIITLPYRAVRAAYRRLLKENIFAKTFTPKVFFHQLRDYIFFLAFGIGYILLSYVFLDGVFRLFGVFFALASFFAGHKFLGRKTEKLTDRLFQWIDRYLINILSFICLPIAFITRLLHRYLYIPVRSLTKQVLCKIRQKLQIRKRMIKSSKSKKPLPEKEKIVWHTFGPTEKFMQNNKNTQNVSRIVDKNN